MKKIAITFGLIGGVLIILYFFLTFLILGSELTLEKLEIAGVIGYLRYLILLLTVIFAMRAYRQQQSSPLTYWQVVKAGIVVSVIVALLVGLMEMFYVIANPEFYDSYATLTIEGMRKQGASAQEIADFETLMKDLAWIRPPGMTGLFYFVETALIGIVMSFIVGIFMRSKPQPKLAQV